MRPQGPAVDAEDAALLALLPGSVTATPLPQEAAAQVAEAATPPEAGEAGAVALRLAESAAQRSW